MQKKNFVLYKTKYNNNDTKHEFSNIYNNNSDKIDNDKSNTDNIIKTHPTSNNKW